MRVDVEKFLVVGPMSVKDRFFSMMQGLGIMEFISPTPISIEKPQEIETLFEALHILKRRVPVKQITSVTHFREAAALASHVVETNEIIEKEQEKILALEKEISRIEPFGEFSVEEIRKIERETNQKFQFFFARKEKGDLALAHADELFYIDTRYSLDYFVSISKEPKSYPGFIEMKIDRSLYELRAELAVSRRVVDTEEAELSALAHQERFLKQGLIAALNRSSLTEAREKNVQKEEGGELFSATGWIPKNKISYLEVLEKELPIYFSPIKKDESDREPTFLENEGLARSGEDLVNIYDTPSTTDKDPSLWVLCAFGLFFSMIVADAGYGLLLLAVTLFLGYRFRERGGLIKRTLRLSLFLSLGCILWGIFSASFFSISFAPDNPLRDFSILDWMVKKKVLYYIATEPSAYKELLSDYPQLASIKDPLAFIKAGGKAPGDYPIYDVLFRSVLLELTLFIGAVHIILGMIRYLTKSWAWAGWILFIVGGYLYCPSVINSISLIHYLFGVPFVMGAKVGLYLLAGGIGIATVLAIIQKGLEGLIEPMAVITVFADAMSYLRIYALSLAGMILGATFNSMALKFPLYIGIFIIIIGHTVNLSMTLMDGLIHGLRLNFIEWYHYSFEGGGKRFKPLALLELE